MYTPLFDALDAGATVVTVNPRLARSLRSAYNRRQVEHGEVAWRTPSILSFDAWCESLWIDLVDAGYAGSRQLPNAAQESALWERIVDESPEGNGLIQTHRTAEQARDAWCLAAQWAITIPNDDAVDLNDDCRAFVRWSKRYVSEADARAWVDRAQLPDRLIEALDATIIEPPTVVWLVGFSEHTPQQEALIEAARRAGSRVQPFAPHRHDAAISALALPDGDEEIRSAARWTRNLLERGATTVGIVVPDLQSKRARVDAIFSDYLLPSSVLPATGELTRPFNISCGKPLSDYPIISSALIALELCTGLVPIERVGAFLRSPFIGGATSEMSERALLDARLRRKGRTAVRASEILAAARDEDSNDRRHRRGTSNGPRSHVSTRLAHVLEAWSAACREHVGEKLAPSKWARAFAAMLKALEWPGDRLVTSAEHQTLEKWWELLSTYATLDGVIGEESAEGAVRRIARMAAGTDFQPRTDDVPVQILGTLEAAGMRFDHLWIIGMHDEEMPATPKPNPFLPLTLQRAHRVARASAERELQFARIVVDGLLASAPDVIVSYPQSDGERPLEPSPLIAHLDPKRPEELAWNDVRHFATIVYESAADATMRETLGDHAAPAVGSGATVSGGTRIIQDQAACGFRAFANHRLNAEPLEHPTTGLDARQRGTLVHRVFELLWEKLDGHAALTALTDDQLDALVNDNVDAAVDAERDRRPDIFNDRFTEIERTRLKAIVRTELALERRRAPFRVAEREAKRTITIAGITMNVVVDRIDELSDGRKIFLDYKSSTPDHKKWFGDRPDEPQLPMYCTQCEDVAAVAFVQVRASEVKYSGIQSEEGILPLKYTDKWMSSAGIQSWDELVPRWKQVLENVGQQFLRGEAAVSPKTPKTTCMYCQLSPLCRVRDIDGDADGDDSWGDA